VQSDQPNLLLIFPDQLRRRSLGCYGDPNISTPNIDRLASEGCRFNAACSSFPICVPFRYSLLTGQSAHTRFVPSIGYRLSPSERILADVWREAGYHSIYVGKWHLSGGIGGHCPGAGVEKSRFANLEPVPAFHRRRWDKWLGFELRNDHFDTHYFEDDDLSPKRLEGHQTDGLFDVTMEYLRNGWDRNKPFACILSVEAPHFPLQVPTEYEARWMEKEEIVLPANYLEDAARPSPDLKAEDRFSREELERRFRIYHAMIEHLDDNVGRMLAFLEMEKILDNTLVVFFSDHGDMAGSHGESIQRKHHPYEESIGIPLILRGPGVPEGRVVEDVVHTEDLYPTLSALAGGKPGDGLPGLNLSAVAKGEEACLDRNAVYLQFTHEPHDAGAKTPYFRNTWRGIRTRDYKYTVLGPHGTGCEPWQLFDLRNDPEERANLLLNPEHDLLAAELHKTLLHLASQSEDYVRIRPAFGLPGLNL